MYRRGAFAYCIPSSASACRGKRPDTGHSASIHVTPTTERLTSRNPSDREGQDAFEKRTSRDRKAKLLERNHTSETVARPRSKRKTQQARAFPRTCGAGAIGDHVASDSKKTPPRLPCLDGPWRGTAHRGSGSRTACCPRYSGRFPSTFRVTTKLIRRADDAARPACRVRSLHARFLENVEASPHHSGDRNINSTGFQKRRNQTPNANAGAYQVLREAAPCKPCLRCIRCTRCAVTCTAPSSGAH